MEAKTCSRDHGCHVRDLHLSFVWIIGVVSASGEGRITHLRASKPRGRAGTHHRGEAGDESDAVLHLLLGDLHRRAVLLLQRKEVGAVLRHPRMQLHPQKCCDLTPPTQQNNTTPHTHTRKMREATLISGTVILVSGFLSSIFPMSSSRSLVMTGLGGKITRLLLNLSSHGPLFAHTETECSDCGLRALAYVSGNSTALLLILLCRETRYSS